MNKPSMITDVEITSLAERNLARLVAAKEAMGSLYVLHPSNMIKKIKSKKPRPKK